MQPEERAVNQIRSLDVQKPPGIAEAIGWVDALHLLGFDVLTEEAAALTIGSVLKYREDTDVLAERSMAWLVGSDA